MVKKTPKILGQELRRQMHEATKMVHDFDTIYKELGTHDLFYVAVVMRDELVDEVLRIGEEIMWNLRDEFKHAIV